MFHRFMGLMAFIVSGLIAMLFISWLSMKIYGWMYDFSYEDRVRETIREMVKEEYLKEEYRK